LATEQLPIEDSEEWLQLEFVRIAPVSKHDDDAIEARVLITGALKLMLGICINHYQCCRNNHY